MKITVALNRKLKGLRELEEWCHTGRQLKSTKVKLVCNECGKKRLVSAEGNYNERCPRCGGVDWDVCEELETE